MYIDYDILTQDCYLVWLNELPSSICHFGPPHSSAYLLWQRAAYRAELP